MKIDEYLYNWSGNTKLNDIDKSLNQLFNDYYINVSLDHILIKVCVLNSLYNTQIYDTYGVAKHILSLEIDNKLQLGRYSLVNKIARCELGGKEKNFYSFATKYCHWHQQKIYPIYDSYVEFALRKFNKENKFAEFKKEDLKDYQKFINIINLFIQKNNLHKYSLKEVDKYLWLVGKELKQK